MIRRSTYFAAAVLTASGLFAAVGVLICGWLYLLVEPRVGSATAVFLAAVCAAVLGGTIILLARSLFTRQSKHEPAEMVLRRLAQVLGDDTVKLIEAHPHLALVIAGFAGFTLSKNPDLKRTLVRILGD